MQHFGHATNWCVRYVTITSMAELWMSLITSGASVVGSEASSLQIGNYLAIWPRDM